MRRADAVIGLNPADRDCVLPLLADPVALGRDASRFSTPAPIRRGRGASGGPPRLIAVAMMRPGDKLASYRVLGARWRSCSISIGRWRSSATAPPARGRGARWRRSAARVAWAGALGPAALAARLAGRRSLRLAGGQRGLRHGAARSAGERACRSSPAPAAGSARSSRRRQTGLLVAAGRRGRLRRGGAAAARRPRSARAAWPRRRGGRSLAEHDLPAAAAAWPR